MAREVPLVRRAWEVLGRLEVDADTINVERHLSTQFQTGPPKGEVDEIFNPGYTNVFAVSDQGSHGNNQQQAQPRRNSPSSPMSSDQPQSISQVMSPRQSLGFFPTVDLLRPERPRQDSTTYVPSIEQDQPQEPVCSPQILATPTGSQPPSQEPVSRRRSDTPIEKGKTKWRLPFSSSKKPTAGPTGDSSSLSSTALEQQRLEEICLSSLASGQKISGKAKHAKIINAHISQTSTLALFWTQLSIQIWNVEASPPTMLRSIPTESTCLLATIAKSYLAYIIGTRDQKLTVIYLFVWPGF